MQPHPHDVDVKALLRIAVLYNVPIACNRASAATIWALASIIGTGRYLTAIKLSVLIVGVLIGVEIMETYFQSLTRGVHKKYPLLKKKEK